MYQTDPPLSPKERLPTMYDLPSEDREDPGLSDQFHLLQPQLFLSFPVSDWECNLEALPQPKYQYKSKST
jgi:hypothetical protein